MSQSELQPSLQAVVSGAKQLNKLKRFLTTLLQFSSDISPEISERVKILILNLINSRISIEDFHSRLQETTNFPLRPFVIPFLKVNLPLLQSELLFFTTSTLPESLITTNRDDNKSFQNEITSLKRKSEDMENLDNFGMTSPSTYRQSLKYNQGNKAFHLASASSSDNNFNRSSSLSNSGSSEFQNMALNKFSMLLDPSQQFFGSKSLLSEPAQCGLNSTQSLDEMFMYDDHFHMNKHSE